MEPRANGRTILVNGSLARSLKIIATIMAIVVSGVSVFGFVQAIGQDRNRISQLEQREREDREWVEAHKATQHATEQTMTRIEEKLDGQSAQIAVNTQRLDDLLAEVVRLRTELEAHRRQTRQ